MERKCTRGFLVCMAVLGLVALPAFGQDTCATRLTGTCGGQVTVDPTNDTSPGGPIAGSCVSGGGLLDHFFEFTATHSNARLQTDLSSAGSDSDFVVWQVDQADPCNMGAWVEVGCSEDDVGYLGDIAFAGLNAGDIYIVQVGTWGDYANGSYTFDITCPAPGGICGDGVLSTAGDEECDGGDAAACQLACLGDCTCDPVPVPTLPQWGLLGLAALLLGGGAVVFGRLRA